MDREAGEDASLIACHGCDLLVNLSDLPDGGRAACPRCGHFLARYRSDALSRALSYGLAAAVFLIIANSFAFLTMEAGGFSSSMTLPRTAYSTAAPSMPCAAANCRAVFTSCRNSFRYPKASLPLPSDPSSSIAARFTSACSERFSHMPNPATETANL